MGRDPQRGDSQGRAETAAPWVFLFLSLTFGTLYAVITPPFQVPDEPVHFFRAFLVSEGDILPPLERGVRPQPIPESLVVHSSRFTRGLAGNASAKLESRMVREALRTPLLPTRRVSLANANTLGYSSLGYIPQAFGILVARISSESSLMLLYASRLSNLLVASVIIFLGIKRASSNKWLLTLVSLTPMALFMRASASADALTLALAIFFIGLVIGLANQTRYLSSPDNFLLALCSFLIPLTKPVYLPLVLCGFLIPVRNFRNGRRWLALTMSLALPALLGLAVTGLWAQTTLSTKSPKPGVNAAAQIESAFRDPLKTTMVISMDYVIHAPRYVSHAIGRLGWLDTPLPLILLLAYALALVLFGLVDGGDPGWSTFQRLILMGSAVVTLALIGAALYAGWTPVGAEYLEGIQGRYFLPVMALPLLALNQRTIAISPFAKLIAATTLLLLASTTTVWVLLQRFYV